MVGLSGGPLLVGIVSDRAHAAYGDASLGIGLLALAPVLVVTLIAHLAAAASMKAKPALAPA